MKYKGSMVLFSSFVFALFFLVGTVNVYPFGFSERERNTVNLQSFVLSDFGDERDQTNGLIWKSRFSRYAKPLDVSKEMSGPDPKSCNVGYFEAKPLGIPQELESKQKWSLGVKAQYIRKGYNWIEIYPVKVSNSTILSSGKPDANLDGSLSPVNLVGVVKSLDLWVWGGNYKYWMEFYLQDYKGFLHRLPAGDVGYIGWKNLRTKIPDYIPQAEYHVPFLKSIRLEMIKLWAYPEERVDQFYTYFDYLQVQTDVYVERFNGDDLANNRW